MPHHKTYSSSYCHASRAKMPLNMAFFLSFSVSVSLPFCVCLSPFLYLCLPPFRTSHPPKWWIMCKQVNGNEKGPSIYYRPDKPSAFAESFPCLTATDNCHSVILAGFYGNPSTSDIIYMYIWVNGKCFHS